MGTGPAALFCALELESHTSKILLIDKGSKLESRASDTWRDVSSGIGGAGLFSNGALYFDSNAGGFLEEWDPAVAQELMGYVKSLFQKFCSIESFPSIRATSPVEEKLIQAGFKVKRLDRIYHLGSEKSQEVLKAIVRFLVSRNVTISANTLLARIRLTGKQKTLEVQCEGEMKTVRCRSLVLAPGKIGAEWTRIVADELGVAYRQNIPYVGVRVETISNVFKPLAELSHDPKISMSLGHMKIKSHCACPDGYTIAVRYGDAVLVDGVSYRFKKSLCSSFNVLVRTPEITVTDARQIAATANAIGDGYPLVQLYGDFKRSRASSTGDIEKNYVRPTLESAVAADIGNALPSNIKAAIVDFINKLEIVSHGIDAPHTLIYAPVIEWWSNRILVDKFMETNIRGVYAIGDGAGQSQGITMAAASGGSCR